MGISKIDVDRLREKWLLISLRLDERSRRVWAGVEASAYGFGGITLVHRATGLNRLTIKKGQVESLEKVPVVAMERVRAKGGGRKRKTEDWPELVQQIEAIVTPFTNTKGDPMSPLKWTSKSTYRIAEELATQGYKIDPGTVGTILKQQGYSLQLNRKEKEGGDQHEHRDAQFKHINSRVVAQIAAGGPAISVDTKKKELVGNYRNGGREYHPKGEAPKVNVHDFEDKELGKVAPYGVYDINVNEGWVSVGVSSDTAKFAVNTIREWWYKMGEAIYKGSRRLLITADGGGSNSSRSRL